MIKKKISIFVDVQNIYYTSRDIFKANFDYNKFWAATTQDREVVKAYAYATAKSDEKQRQFHNILRAIGFEVKLKPYITRKDGSAKGDWDVGITIDILEYAKDSDIIILASGDGDFAMLIKYIKEKYKLKTEIYGVENLTANALINEADKFVPITTKLLINKK